MQNKWTKKLTMDSLINVLGLIFFVLLFRRGGDSKNKVAVLLIIASFYCISKYRFEIVRKYIYLYIFGGLYLFWMGVSFYLSVNKGFGRFDELLGMSIYSILFFLAIINIKLEEKIYLKLIPIMSILSIESLVRGFGDLYSNINRLSWYRLSGRVYTTIYAAELGICIILGVGSIFMYKNRYIKISYSIYTILSIILLYFTKSRNSMLMIPLTLCLIILLKNKKKGIVFIFTILIILGSLIGSASKIKGLERLTTISSVEKIKNDPRYEIFKIGIAKSKEHLFLGEGFYYHKDKGIKTTKAGLQPHYHNIFMETFVTQGLVTFIFYVLFTVSVIGYMLKNYFLEKNQEIKKVRLLAIGIYIFTLLYGMAEPIFYFSKIYILSFTFLALNFITIKKED